jgi:hypothetical protein
MFEPIAKITAAIIVAGVVATAVTVSPAANEHGAQTDQVEQALTQPLTKADRLRVPARETSCLQQNWPNFEPRCQLGIGETVGEPRAVRIIALR